MKRLTYILFFLPSICSALTVGFFGDSVTYGHLVDPRKRFSEITKDLLKEKGIEIQIINRGVNCQITKETFETIIDQLKTKTFDIAVIGSGINDASIKVPFLEIRRNYDAMIKILLALNIKVIIGIVEPKYIIPDYEIIFDELYRHIYQQYPVAFFKLLSTDILEHHCIDNVHPTTQGHRIIAEKLIPVLEVFLKN